MAKKDKNKMVITKEQILIMERGVRRAVDIENGFKGCTHKAHKMATDFDRKKSKRINWED